MFTSKVIKRRVRPLFTILKSSFNKAVLLLPGNEWWFVMKFTHGYESYNVLTTTWSYEKKFVLGGVTCVQWHHEYFITAPYVNGRQLGFHPRSSGSAPDGATTYNLLMAKKDDNNMTRDGAHVLVGTPVPLAEKFSVPGEQPVKVIVSTENFVALSEKEREVLKIVLDRQRTSQLVHGGLKSLLTLNDEQAETLLGFLRKL